MNEEIFLKTLIRSLIEANRLTADSPIKLDGNLLIEDINTPLIVDGPESVTNINTKKEELIYDENGICLNDVSVYGGLRLKSIVDLITDWSKSENLYERQAALQQPTYYCFNTPYALHTDAQLLQIKENQQTNWMSSMYGGEINDFYLYKPRYTHIKTGEGIFRDLTPTEYYSGEWERTTGNRMIDKIPNHAVVTKGNYSNILHPKWKTEFFDNIGKYVEKSLRSKADYLEYIAIHGTNPFHK